MAESFGKMQDPHIASKTQYFFERDCFHDMVPEFDVKVLRSHKDKLLLANGADSNHEALQHRTDFVLRRSWACLFYSYKECMLALERMYSYLRRNLRKQ